MPQTPQNKIGILAPFGLKPIFRSMFYNGGIGGSPLGYGPILHVSKTGSDSNNGSILSPFLTINKAMSVGTVGCTIQVHAQGGVQTIYSESTTSSQHVPAQTWFEHPAAVGVRVSGTILNRCTLMAFPGHEGLVTIDGGNTHVGILANNHDYWNIYGIRIKNCKETGIVNHGQVPNHIPIITDLSIGWNIENCLVDGVVGAAGGNISGIAPWSTKDWTVRNCLVKNVGGHGIQTYGAIDLLVENIQTDNVYFSVFLKDHFISTDNPRTPYNGVEVRYSKLKSRGSAINIGIRGSGSCEAGYQNIHHNLMYGFDGMSDEAVQFRMLDAAAQSTRFRLANNVIDVGSAINVHVVGNNFNDVEIEGNIFCGGTLPISTHYNDFPGQITRITSCDRNVYTTFAALLCQYGSNSTTYFTLPEWQAAVAGAPSHLGISNPDLNSVEANASSLFTNRVANDYTLASGSAAIGRMSDGSDAGIYQYRTETLGLLPSYSAGV